jgi:hypothetical protein
MLQAAAGDGLAEVLEGEGEVEEGDRERVCVWGWGGEEDEKFAGGVGLQGGKGGLEGWAQGVP